MSSADMNRLPHWQQKHVDSQQRLQWLDTRKCVPTPDQMDADVWQGTATEGTPLLNAMRENLNQRMANLQRQRRQRQTSDEPAQMNRLNLEG